VNNTQPLPRGLLAELLPQVSECPSAKLASKQLPSKICDLLARSSDSPFEGLIRRSSLTGGPRRRAVVSDTAVMLMVEESLNHPSGCLFAHQNIAAQSSDLDAILATLTHYWRAVRDVFPDAWGLPPVKSRLMHGAGIRAMGRLMDKVMRAPSVPMQQVTRSLKHVAPFCKWTAGRWPEINLEWNQLQNTPGHVNWLGDYLVRKYLAREGSK
ncbi:MAG TPA: DGQHR domain-containing protein, partial [Fimbriimonadaceae bacterium]|nr:DGQHR domain-containing protein [Fimbriimonadaceae bacterium]